MILFLQNIKYKELVKDSCKKRMSGEEVTNSYGMEILVKDGRKIPADIKASEIEYEGRSADCKSSAKNILLLLLHRCLKLNDVQNV